MGPRTRLVSVYAFYKRAMIIDETVLRLAISRGAEKPRTKSMVKLRIPKPCIWHHLAAAV